MAGTVEVKLEKLQECRDSEAKEGRRHEEELINRSDVIER